MLNKFGIHIRKIRLQQNMTQLDVAVCADLDRNYIGLLERGQRNPSLVSLAKLAKGLNVSLADLMSFDYEK